MLSSTEHEISTAQKLEYRQLKKFLALRISDVVFIMLINDKMPTIVGILSFMSRINFALSSVEPGKSFITSGPGLTCDSRNLKSQVFLRRISVDNSLLLYEKFVRM